MSSVTSKPSEKNLKPSGGAFKQQRLPAWKPILTAGSVLPTFFLIGIAFIPVGIGLIFLSNDVKEVVVDYTDCKNVENVQCSEVISQDREALCNCTIPFELQTDFVGEVYMYYALTNFYQNHRRYVKSYDGKQLRGKVRKELSSDCIPFDKNDEGKPIAPCGAIANSLFSDELSLEFNGQWKKNPVPLLRTGISWPSDREFKFRNPPGNLSDALKEFVKPMLWKKNIWELDLENPENNGFQNEDLIVWMRTSSLPHFRKLYRRVDHKKTGFFDGLPKGNYTLYVNYSFLVSTFNGRKKMILSTTCLLGGKNPFLGLTYVVVGCISVLLGILFLFIHVRYGKTQAEMIDVDPSTPYHMHCDRSRHIRA